MIPCVEVHDVALDELQSVPREGLERDVETVPRAADVETDDVRAALDERPRRPRADRAQHAGDEIAPAGLAHDGSASAEGRERIPAPDRQGLRLRSSGARSLPSTIRER